MSQILLSKPSARQPWRSIAKYCYVAGAESIRTLTILGLEIPDAGPVFAISLAFHVAAGLTGVVGGALAASAPKRRGRHPKAGRVYLWAIAVVLVTATAMAAVRWREDRHLLAIAVVAAGLAWWGWRSRVRVGRGWVRRHAIGMGGSYIALLTGFYVDNGPQLPLWDRLPHWTYWVLPAAVGIPLTAFALRRFHSRPAYRR